MYSSPPWTRSACHPEIYRMLVKIRVPQLNRHPASLDERLVVIINVLPAILDVAMLPHQTPHESTSSRRCATRLWNSLLCSDSPPVGVRGKAHGPGRLDVGHGVEVGVQLG